ncbi:LamG domain-containing protein [Flavobacterium terrigena]|uniref:Concanavalin A-like lectin/glucanases superfamily protein n=1 Tax=Flavobacterium terrigena TaxID=402734 RepID=A0A1H6R6S0_9FLAO|nr:LamG domain-containing protein [Flavobacterium terrigena]SEI47325.1 Concanavalin A-like lectin/glucanases superfamily protein [Flavobacterium terrigena]
MKLKNIALLLATTILLSCNDEDDKATKKASCLPINLQTDIIAFYPFSNGSLNDVSGNNYNLTNPTTANSGMDRDGNPNCGFSFNSTNGDFLEYQNPTFLDNLTSTGMSISFWYKSNDMESGNFIMRDIAHYCDFSNGVWSVHHVNNMIITGTNNGYGMNYGVATSNWQHIVVTSKSNGVQLFVDGTLITSANNSSCPDLNQGNLFIGKEYDGLIDDVIIYNRVLSQTEVNQLHNLPACCE